MVDEDTLNTQVRKFLRVVGVTSQGEIENAVRAAAAAGKLRPGQTVKATMRLQIPELGLDHVVDADLEVA